MQFDARGRLWVAVWPSYPHWKPTEEMNDKILIFEDTKGTGKADKVTVFADHLNCPTGFEFYNGGVLVAQAPDLLFLKDTKGTGKADLRVRVVHGLDSADSHHTSNSFALDPGGALYFQEGTFHHTQVETPYGPPQRCVNGGVFRYEPRARSSMSMSPTASPIRTATSSTAGAQDIVVRRHRGQSVSRGPVLRPSRLSAETRRGRRRSISSGPGPAPAWKSFPAGTSPRRTRATCWSPTSSASRASLQYKIADKGSSFAGTEVGADPLLDAIRNFRPSDIKMGPDGAIWFIDWHNPIIGHLQHAIRDPAATARTAAFTASPSKDARC